MPRGVPKNKEDKTKVNVAKANEGRAAEELLNLLETVKQDRKEKLISMIATHPISDLDDIVRDYKACERIGNELSALIAKGKIAVNKLNKEDK